MSLSLVLDGAVDNGIDATALDTCIRGARDGGGNGAGGMEDVAAGLDLAGTMVFGFVVDADRGDEGFVVELVGLANVIGGDGVIGKDSCSHCSNLFMF